MAQSKPDSTDPVYTPGTARGAKLAALLVDEGTPLLRNIFEEEVKKMNPPSLREQLENHRGCLYDNEPFTKQGTSKKCRVNLNAGQKKTLYPRGCVVPDTAQGFDISLLERLLNDLVWLGLGRDAPYADHRNRFRLFRNDNYGHISSTDLSEEDFDRLWKELSEILVALGGDKDKISERLNQSIDPELEAEYFDLLEKLYKDDMELKAIVLAQGERLRKGQEEILEELRNLPEKVRDAQSAGKDSGQREDSSSSTGLADVADDGIDCLKDLYKEAKRVRPLPWCEEFKPLLEQVFTNLQLQQRDDCGRFQDTGTIVSIADIYHARAGEDVQVNTMSAVRRLRIEGDPGIGKSCSCQKLAYDWSCGKLDRFKVVLFLEMRHLAGKVKDAIFEQLQEDTNMTDQLWSYIKENQKDVLFILDGLDELSQTAREVTDVVKLIQGKILRNCHVLVTSRPYHCVEDLKDCDQFYKIVGYTKKNSRDCIHKYCKSQESASKLVQQLNSNMYLSEIAVNPLNNVLMCVVWEENKGKLPSRKADLYENIVYSVSRRYCKKTRVSMEDDILPPTIDEALRGLGKLSWEGLEQEQLQFKMDEIKRKYGTNADNMLSIGLLTRDNSISRIKRTCLCAFLHKTFQEFMAARYISDLVINDGSNREEGMKCLRSLFGLNNGSEIDRELILSSRSKYREVQDLLLSILGENANPLFDMFAEELNNAKTDRDRELLSFLCVLWLGKIESAGVRMAEIVAPCLLRHLTNINNLEGFSNDFVSHINWCVGLMHVLTCQKKLASTNNPRLTQHLTVDLDRIGGIGADHSLAQEKLDMLESTLSDYGTMRSVTLRATLAGTRVFNHTFSPLPTLIPRNGAERVSFHINIKSLVRSLKQLSEVPRLEDVSITVESIDTDQCDTDFSEYDRVLAQMIRRQSSLKSIKLEIKSWNREDPETGNLTATLQSISEHTKLEVVEFTLPRTDGVMVVNEELQTIFQTYTFNVKPTVQELTECIKNNRVLKTLRLQWRRGLFLKNNIEDIVCNRQSLSRLFSAIRRNQTLETLVIEEMFCDFEGHREIIDDLKHNKPSNYKELSITMIDRGKIKVKRTFQAAAAGDPIAREQLESQGITISFEK